MMKKMLTLVLLLAIACGVSASSVTLVGIAPGEPGSVENPLYESDTIQIQVTTDTTLVGLDAILTVASGPGTIVGAIGLADAVSYGWDEGLSFDPIVTGQSAEIGMGNFGGNAGPIVGYYELHCDGPGDVVVTLSSGSYFGGSMDINYGTPDIYGELVIHQVPEPMTMGLLGLGGLFLRRRKK